MAVPTYRFAKEKGSASTIPEIAAILIAHEPATMLGINKGITGQAADQGAVAG